MQLKNNEGRFRIVRALLIIKLGAEFVYLIICLYGKFLIAKVRSGNYNEQYLNIFDWIERSVLLIGTGIGFGLIVAFILWFRRAYFNAHRFALTPLRYSEGWAAASWFVPVLNLFRPVRIMRELWYETIAFLRFRSPYFPPGNIQYMISLWWFTWLISNWIGNVSFRISLKSKTVDDYDMVYSLDIASGIFMLISGVALIYIMQHYHRSEEELKIVANSEMEHSIFYNSVS